MNSGKARRCTLFHPVYRSWRNQDTALPIAGCPPTLLLI